MVSKKQKFIKLKNGLILGYSSELEIWRADSFFTKEPETIEWINYFSGLGNTFFDIGANVGGYSVYAAHKNNNLKVYAFEPVANNFRLINKNIGYNRLTNIFPFQIGISSEDKLTEVYLSDLRDGNSGAQLNNPVNEIGNHFNPKAIQPVISFKLDSLIYNYKFPCPDFIKIDVDGLESEIINGSSKLLYNPQLKSLLIEFNSQNIKSKLNKIIIEAGLLPDNYFNSLHNHSSLRRKENTENKAMNVVYSRKNFLFK